MTTPADLDRRLSRRIEQGKGMNLTADDLDLLVVSGAYEVLRAYAAQYQRDQCRARNARSRSTSAGPIASIRDQAGSFKSSGMTSNASASEELARALQMLGKGELN
ncbi:MAG: hypothetical protein MK060_12870 [Blastomonas sp.]|uniref:hypothetical protein n=1 Tax=Blastomonas sp. TaxID=1909299 RepID=UPI00406AA46D|nr:hypothetical protein [Blastomonas sp.]